MMKKVIIAVLGFSLALSGALFAGASGNTSSPVGIWKTIDDATGEAKSHVEIRQLADGTLEGKVIKLIPRPGKTLITHCDKCEGDRKGQPIVGMVILWDMKPEDPGQTVEWDSGHILDPKNGKTYGCNIKLSDDGKQLEVRGFIGISLFGRTQVWHRVQ